MSATKIYGYNKTEAVGVQSNVATGFARVTWRAWQVCQFDVKLFYRQHKNCFSRISKLSSHSIPLTEIGVSGSSMQLNHTVDVHKMQKLIVHQ